ncbi:TETRASPANIN-19-LIKE [Salix purpurea]|uniref:TETRASPANIN-19-LIKE n=1 Tax=Salix purpurea TaxID=77065 RepID=A0A9Q0ULR3_SALPP|nr:TETRASPANIN-19-LIKE [Salix purpurea]KAJ6732454.1 TETRASPANIN-19-LIKE [Salix purpurea]
MARCARCCLRNSIRIVNLVMLLCGAGMIIYSLWLQKKWDESIAEFPRSSSPLKPWFIYTFLGVGIIVCLSTIGGYIITNCISNSTLCLVSFLLISFIMTRRRKEPLKFSRLRHFQGLFNH